LFELYYLIGLKSEYCADPPKKQILHFDPTKETLVRKQFPLTPCKSLTCHKVQGLTLPSVCIDMFICQVSKKRGWLYVALSRVKKIEDLYILDWDQTIEDWLLSDDLLSQETKKFDEKLTSLVTALVDLSCNPFD